MAKLHVQDVEAWTKAQYGIACGHAAVQICSWTKKALRGKGVCYKQKFYGVDCHRCAQVTPLVAWCDQNCIFCWRPASWMEKAVIKEDEVEKPEVIIPALIEERKRLISGIGGAEDVVKELFKQSYDLFPSHWAISLSGEPTLYPWLGEMISLIRQHDEVKSIFVVSNGQHPEVIKKLWEEDRLPTQLYISLTSPNPNKMAAINRPKNEDAWARLNETLSTLGKVDCRTVIRLTLIKGVNDSHEDLKAFAKMIENSQADFIEIKSYMCLGESRTRLTPDNMLSFPEIKKKTHELLHYLTTYGYENEHAPSRICLLKNNSSPYQNIIISNKCEKRSTNV